MPYYPTQKDILLLGFSEKTFLVKVILMNEKFQSLYEFKGEYISGDISTNTDSEIRNTLSLSLAITDESIDFAPDKKLWIDKLIKIFVGVESPFIESPVWYDKGIFVMTDFNIDSINQTLSVNCSDLVSKINGDLGGSLKGLSTIIYSEDKFSIREAIITTLTDLTPFTKYSVVDMPKLVPYDLEFSASDFIWSILVKLRDLYPGYEMFFDTDGTFVCRKIAVNNSDPIVLDDSILHDLYVTETVNGDAKNVRNVSQVWGKCLETDYYTVDCSYSSSTNTYSAYFTGLPINSDGSLPTSTKYAVKINSTNASSGAKLAIYNRETENGSSSHIGTFDVVNSLEENIDGNFFTASRTYVFRYRRETMLVMGQWQIVAVNILRNTSPTLAEKNKYKADYGCDDITYTIIVDSPFAIERIGERYKSYSGGEYDDIQQIDDCITRAEYETWKSAKIGYTVSLDMVYIPWLQGNEKIRYTPHGTNTTKDWVVSSISTSLNSGMMSVTLVEFEPLYNFEIKE